jgi:hypothetical protein
MGFPSNASSTLSRALGQGVEITVGPPRKKQSEISVDDGLSRPVVPGERRNPSGDCQSTPSISERRSRCSIPGIRTYESARPLRDPSRGTLPDHRRWIHSRYHSLLPRNVLSRVFRGKFVAGLKKSHTNLLSPEPSNPSVRIKPLPPSWLMRKGSLIVSGPYEF